MQLTMNEIMDTPIEECLHYFKTLPKGVLINLQKLFELQYEQVTQIKEGILVLINSHDNGTKKMTDKEYEEHKKCVDNLYVVLQLIEDRYNIVKELLNNINEEESKRVGEAVKGHMKEVFDNSNK